MKKIIFLLAFFSFLLSQKSFAQPSYYFSPQQLQVDSGDNFCLDLKVKNFSFLTSVQFTVKFDPAVLDFQMVSNINANVLGLDITDFGTATSGQGYITFIWSDGQPCQSAVGGETLPDDATLFSLCFTAIGDYGYHSLVEITDSPIDIITRRVTANCFDIGEEYLGSSYVSIGTNPLTINISSVAGNPGDVVCVDFKVEDFTDLISAQYYVFWDTDVLEYSSSMTMNLGTQGDQYNINYSPAFGMLSSVWFHSNLNQGVTLPDGTQILQMCFKIIGNCGQSSPIYISQNNNSSPPEPIEIIDAVTAGSIEGVNIGLLQTQGIVTVNCNNPNSITINMDDKNVCPGEDFTVDVKVEDFSQIVQLMFDLKWNPGVIQLDTVTYPVQPGSSCLPFSNGVDDADKALGLLHMDWITQSQGCNKPDGYIIMRLHFHVVGPSGSTSTIAVTNPIFVDKFGGQPVDIGINTNNSLVTVCQLDQPTVTIESENGNPGTQVCLNFNVQDFDDLTQMGYTIAWEPNILQFASIQGLNLTNLTMSDFQTVQAGSLGVLGLDWSNATGVTVPDGVTIFTVCYNLIGDPGDCSPVSIEESPWPIVVETATPNAGNVGLNGQPGQVCILDPFILNLSIPDTYGGPLSNVCVDLTVDNFDQLTNTEFSINWDPSILSFQSLTPSGALPNFGPSNFNTSNAADGDLTIDWAAANQVLGQSLADGSSLFELCFKLVGDPSECSPVSISGYPQNIIINSATTGNSNLNISANNGSICVGASINLLGYDVTDVTCGSMPDGSIVPQVNGGSGQYAFNWSGPGVNPTAATQTNLNVGYYIVTITDVQNPALKIIQPFNIVYAADAIFANAGQDTTRSCGNGNTMILNGTGSAIGPNITYKWNKLGLGIITSDDTTLNPSILGSGAFELVVTGPGCIDRDTVLVAGSQTPVPHIKPADSISCKQDTILLDGTQTPIVNGFQIQWTGPAVDVTTEHDLIAKVSAPGWYYLTLENPNTNCMSIDSIEVIGDLDKPIADAGVDTVLGCSTSFVPIGGASSTGTNIMYDWVPLGAGQICGNPQAMTLNACSPGMFELTVTDTLNGCFITDTVAVTADTLKPISNAGADQTLTCLIDDVTLDGSASSAGADFTYTWRLVNAVVAQDSPTITVSTPGIYQLEVIDNSNNCSAVSEVEVINGKTLPSAASSHTNDISCLLPTDTLDATGSTTGTDISYEWFNNGTSVGTGLTAVVNTPGDYVLVVTDASNGCTSTDTINVGDLTTPPNSMAVKDNDIDCNGDGLIHGVFDINNPNLQFIWQGPGLGCIQNPNAVSTTVSCDGDYIFKVYDSITGCVGSSTVAVTQDKVKPIANAGNDAVLQCAGSSLILNGSTDATDYTVNWGSVQPNLPISDPTILTPTVTQPGTYSLVITSNINGCSSTADLVVVTLGNTNFQANAGADGVTDCLNTLYTIDASGSTFSGTDDVIEWQKLDGTFVSDQVSVDVSADTYQLSITTTEGCVSLDTVVVTDISENFITNITTPDTLSCDNPSIELVGSSTSAGTNLSYVWKENGTILQNGTTYTVSTPGTYTLLVTNADNNCSDSTSVTVIQSNPNLTDASAQADYVDCEAEATLIGNLPANTTGQWTSLTGASIDTPNSEMTTATGFEEGANQFVWTLSLGDCQNYSSDTVTITVNQVKPDAVNDNAILQPGTGGQVSINVLENDEFTEGNIQFTLLPGTYIGTATSTAEGNVTYAKENCVVGNIIIPYQICDLTCPSLCDSATLTVDVIADPADPCGETPNGITPNGDGVNDELVFDELLNTTEPYPDNEIIIFNRWGDVVYQAKPYLNNWGGTNQSGKELPHATYYYILRLNIADGNILRGDVTILK